VPTNRSIGSVDYRPGEGEQRQRGAGGEQQRKSRGAAGGDQQVAFAAPIVPEGR